MEVIEELKKVDSTYPSFVRKSIKVGKYSLSIQSSSSHYCIPRNNTNLDNYTHMEMAILVNHKFLNVRRSSILRSFPRYDELIATSDSFVFGYVPIDLINDLYLYLVNLNKNEV